jgi:hypothetical protein
VAGHFLALVCLDRDSWVLIIGGEYMKDNSVDKSKPFKDFFYSLLLPDEKVSIKLFFDNLRNYLICGAIFYAGNKFMTSMKLIDHINNIDNLSTYTSSKWVVIILFYALVVLPFATFLFLNIYQTYLLIRKLVKEFTGIIDRKYAAGSGITHTAANIFIHLISLGIGVFTFILIPTGFMLLLSADKS